MANELHRKLLVAEVGVDFNTAATWSQIDSLPAGDMCWSAPITTLEDCEFAEFFVAISGGPTSPEGSVEFYAGKAGANLRAANEFATLTDHGTEGTTATIASMLQCLDLLDQITWATEADTTFTKVFELWYPGADCQLFILNNTDEALDGTASPHKVYVRGWGSELQ